MKRPKGTKSRRWGPACAKPRAAGRPPLLKERGRQPGARQAMTVPPFLQEGGQGVGWLGWGSEALNCQDRKCIKPRAVHSSAWRCGRGFSARVRPATSSGNACNGFRATSPGVSTEAVRGKAAPRRLSGLPAPACPLERQTGRSLLGRQARFFLVLFLTWIRKRA